MEKNKAVNDPKVILSTLWIFYVLNILYADVLNLMSEAVATTSEAEELINTLLSPEMLLSTAIFLELAMVMVILSRLLKYGMNRWANIIVASLHTLGLIASVFVGTPMIFYIFFVVVEVSALLFIIWYAWSWKETQYE
ncbi:hypothetical protein A8B79_09215 [Balneola sp. EhC07]|jgi:hypothetical protein|uniref:DUF6326 family protein n=1 Tax=Balneola sp. EhC07 TaxID=1849360 RepID=UPI0007F52314|nr:DUF6326 family protein [Balneola sp. EhC07]OAN60691.1 hypothetical protein A8B79_09215 [Balneola sp. EhC07]